MRADAFRDSLQEKLPGLIRVVFALIGVVRGLLAFSEPGNLSPFVLIE